MSAVKVSVSLDEGDLAWLKQTARRRKQSVSSVLTEAVRKARRERALDDVLQWLDAGALPPEKLEEYRRLWRMD